MHPKTRGEEKTDPRVAALKVLVAFEQKGQPLDRLLQPALEKSNLERRDRALVTELVSGTVRWSGYLDGVLERLLTSNLPGLTASIRNILRLAAYQILFLDRIPPSAATNEAVKAAYRFGHRGVAGLVNAVLRNLVRHKAAGYPLLSDTSDPVADLARQESFPVWLVRRWVKRYGLEEARQLCMASNQRPAICLRWNETRVSWDALLEAFIAAGLKVQPGRYLQRFFYVSDGGDVTQWPGYHEGWFAVQDESAGLAPQLVDPQAGEKVVDLCSAPGGKLLQLWAQMKQQGLVLALDLYRMRISLLQQNVARLGLAGVIPMVADGRRFGLKYLVDRVLVDVPCSGLGVLRRHPDIRWRRQKNDIFSLQRVQQQLLENAARLVRVGGRVVYSTCTIEPEENQAVVEAFLGTNPEFDLEDARPFVPPSVVVQPGYVTTLPHRHGIDGVFAARLVRRA